MPTNIDGIQISSNNVTLHLNGHSIDAFADGGTCNIGAGIFISNASSANVVGPAEINNFVYGVAGYQSPGSSVSFMKITVSKCESPGGQSIGFYLDATEPNDHWTLLGNVVRLPGPSYGIWFDGNSSNKVVGNTANQPIILNSSSNDIVPGNTIISSKGGYDENAGIYLSGGSNNQILSNTTKGHAASGIVLSGTTGNLTA